MMIRVCLVVSLALMVAAAGCKSEKATPSASATPERPSATPASVATLPASTPGVTPTAAAAPTTATPSDSTLTSEQQQEILDLISRDPNVLRVMQGLAVANTKIVLWNNGQGTLIGCATAITLAQPATIDGEWRSVAWVDSSQTTYGVTIYTAKLSNVTTVNVWIDLGKGAVVGWSANSDAKVETGPVIITPPAIQ
jgi:hypothetical protein